MGPRCSSAETQVCHRSYIIAASLLLQIKRGGHELIILQQTTRPVLGTVDQVKP